SPSWPSVLLLRAPTSALFAYTTLFRSALRVIDTHAIEGGEVRFAPVGLALQALDQLELALVGDGDVDFRSGDVFREGREHSFGVDRKSTRLNSSHVKMSYAFVCLKKKG